MNKLSAGIPLIRPLVVAVAVAHLTCWATWLIAQDTFDPSYTTGEIDLLEKQYLGSDEKVGGKANFLHGIGGLQKLVPGMTLEGNGVIVAVWDGGLIQANHQDLTPRVIIKDPQQAKLFLSNHATHVAGTIGGTGRGRPAAKGVAPGAILWSYDFGDDLAEMKHLANSGAGVNVSNHSYSVNTGWSGICEVPTVVAGGKSRLAWVWAGLENDNEDRRFGQYGPRAVGFDAIAQQHPEWTMVVAAGNARNPLLDPHNAAQTVGGLSEFKSIADKYDFSFTGASRLWKCAGKTSSMPHRSNRHDLEGYDSIPYGPAAGKNVITVGAMKDPPFDTVFDSATGRFRPLERKHVVTTNFSSWGSVDDGRIKPDIVASGHAVLATAIPQKCGKTCKPADVTGAGENANYVQMSGTSMAAPVVSGAVTLLNELSIKKRTRSLRSDEAKAILIHTALSPAGVEGPTYKVGWGAMQAELAGRLLIGSGQGESTTMVKIAAGKTAEISLKREGLRPPRITLVWLDEQGVTENGLDTRTPRLVNDINMTLTAPSGDVIHPWTLDPNNPFAPAKRGNNTRDNVERIDVPSDKADDGAKWVLRIGGEKWQSTTEVKAALAVWGFSRAEDTVEN